MRALFFIGIVMGLAAVLTAARFVQWVDPVRLPSHTSVVANGGRAETFVIRLPADRLSAHGAASAGLRAAAHPAGTALPAELVAAPVLVEHFKVRDVDGDVIGTAARHWTASGDDAGAAAWLLSLPGRGAMMLSASGETPAAVDRALASAGRRPDSPWAGEVRVAIVAERAPGSVAGGSDEFVDLEGRYTETWIVTGVGEDGQLKGTVELGTVTFANGV